MDRQANSCRLQWQRVCTEAAELHESAPTSHSYVDLHSCRVCARDPHGSQPSQPFSSPCQEWPRFLNLLEGFRVCIRVIWCLIHITNKQVAEERLQPQQSKRTRTGESFAKICPVNPTAVFLILVSPWTVKS